MKKIIFLIALFASSNAYANISCGIKPITAPWCDNVCICNDYGTNCRWVNVCN